MNKNSSKRLCCVRNGMHNNEHLRNVKAQNFFECIPWHIFDNSSRDIPQSDLYRSPYFDKLFNKSGIFQRTKSFIKFKNSESNFNRKLKIDGNNEPFEKNLNKFFDKSYLNKSISVNQKDCNARKNEEVKYFQYEMRNSNLLRILNSYPDLDKRIEQEFGKIETKVVL